jgi:murein DD-endopeptidase MepM/ murein hydrolase activator NlpD
MKTPSTSRTGRAAREAALAYATGGVSRKRQLIKRTAPFVLGPLLAVLVAIAILPALITAGLGSSGSSAAAAVISEPSQIALADIPANYLRACRSAEREFKVDWAIICSIYKQESGFGQGTAAGIRSGLNYVHCCRGPGQFNTQNGRAPIHRVLIGGGHSYTYQTSSTWDAYKVDGNHDGVFDVYNFQDAVPSTAFMLKLDGAALGQAGWFRAVYSYNPSVAYVREVLARAASYRRILASSGDWTLPVAKCQLSTGYGVSYPGDPWVHGHTGQDFSAARNTPIYSVGDGTVVTAAYDRSYGNETQIQYPDGMYALYAHQDHRAPGIHRGVHVTTGELIGYVGDTGNAYGAHLHFEVRTKPYYGYDVDPMAWLAGHGVKC